jgi:hypothetical protein
MHHLSNLSRLVAQQRTAQKVIDAYNAWEIDKIMAYRAPECQHRLLPSSMNPTAKSNDEYRTYLTKIMPLFSNFTVILFFSKNTSR